MAMLNLYNSSGRQTDMLKKDKDTYRYDNSILSDMNQKQSHIFGEWDTGKISSDTAERELGNLYRDKMNAVGGAKPPRRSKPV